MMGCGWGWRRKAGPPPAAKDDNRKGEVRGRLGEKGWRVGVGLALAGFLDFARNDSKGENKAGTRSFAALGMTPKS